VYFKVVVFFKEMKSTEMQATTTYRHVQMP